MLWWVVDNVGVVYLVLGILLLALAARWWLTRRGGYVIALGVTAGLIVLVWVLSLLIITDRKQLVATVRAIENSINHRDVDSVFKHIADEVTVHSIAGRAKVSKASFELYARGKLKEGSQGVTVWNIDVEELARPRAVLTFYVRAEDTNQVGLCTAEFVFVREGVWQMNGFTLEKLMVGGKVPMQFPF